MEHNVNTTEQWKTHGDCDKCRRQPFCSKQCTAKKKNQVRRDAAFKAAIMESILPGSSQWGYRY